MDVFEAIANRRSMRTYTNAPVSREKLMQVLEAARLAPSWKNDQGWRFLVLDNRADILALGQALGQNPNQAVYETVPYCIIVCAHPQDSGIHEGKEYYLVDCAIAMEHMVLAAEELGLATCWVGLFEEAPVRRAFDIPDAVKIVGVLPLGVAGKVCKPRPRKAMEEIAFLHRWGQTLK